MKTGIRTPSIKRSVKARTTGRIKRAAKSSVNPLYGKKGVGYIKDPGKALKNSVYHKVTIDPLDSFKHTSDGPAAGSGSFFSSSSTDTHIQTEPVIRRPILGKGVKFLILFTIIFLICLYIVARL